MVTSLRNQIFFYFVCFSHLASITNSLYCSKEDCDIHIKANNIPLWRKYRDCKNQLISCSIPCPDAKDAKHDPKDHEIDQKSAKPEPPTKNHCDKSDTPSQCSDKFIQHVNSFDFYNHRREKFTAMLDVLSDMKESAQTKNEIARTTYAGELKKASKARHMISSRTIEGLFRKLEFCEAENAKINAQSGSGNDPIGNPCSAPDYNEIAISTSHIVSATEVIPNINSVIIKEVHGSGWKDGQVIINFPNITEFTVVNQSGGNIGSIGWTGYSQVNPEWNNSHETWHELDQNQTRLLN